MDSKIETKKKKSFSTFVKERKREITISVLAIGTLVTGMVIYKKHNGLLEKATEHIGVPHLEVKSVKENIPDLLLDKELSKTINVPEHTRKLPEGRNRSKNAEELAKKFNCILPDDKTFVSPYSYIKKSA